MPKIALEIKANLENITDLVPDGDDFRWYVKLKCSNCGETPDHWQYIIEKEKHDVEGSRGSASLVEKCKLCKRQNQIDVIKGSTHAYTQEKNLEWQRLVVFECRGLEPIDFDPRIGWKAKGTDSNTPFEVDLSEKDWCEYDEKAGESVGVYELEHRFVRS